MDGPFIRFFTCKEWQCSSLQTVELAERKREDPPSVIGIQRFGKRTIPTWDSGKDAWPTKEESQHSIQPCM